MTAVVIDLVDIDDKYLYRLYCQLKEIDEYGLIRRAQGIGDSYEVLEILQFSPVETTDVDVELFSEYLDNKTVSFFEYASKLNLSTKLALEKLLDVVFSKNTKLVLNFGRIMRELAVPIGLVNELRDFLSNSAPSNVRDVFANINIIPFDLEIILAVLYNGIDENLLNNQYEEYAFAEPVLQLSNEDLEKMNEEIEKHTKPVEEAAAVDRLHFEKEIADMKSNNEVAEAKILELDTEIKEMKSTIDELVKKHYDDLKIMCLQERCVIDEKTPAEIYCPPKKVQKLNSSANSVQPMNLEKMSQSSTDVCPEIQSLDNVHRSMPLTQSMPPKAPISLIVSDPCLAIDAKNDKTWSLASIVKITQNEVVVKFENTGFSLYVSKACVAFTSYPTWLLPVGCRVVAFYKGFTTDTFSGWIGGIIGEQPVEGRNKYRYLIFFDNAEAQYVGYTYVRRVYGPSSPGFLDIADLAVREFVANYVKTYPERAVVRLKPNQTVKVLVKDNWVKSRVSEVDAMMVRVNYCDGSFEWLYRGNKRLEPMYLQDRNCSLNIQSGRRCRRNRQKAAVVEFLSDDDGDDEDDGEDNDDQSESVFGFSGHATSSKCQVARKSTAAKPTRAKKQADLRVENLTEIDYELTNEILDSDSHNIEYHLHRCSPECISKDDNPANFKRYNPLSIPMRCDWNRFLPQKLGQQRKVVLYSAPCGKRLRSLAEVTNYLITVNSKLTMDLFCFDPLINCLTYCRVKNPIFFDKDITNGKESVPIECANTVNNEHPSKMNYQPRRYTDDRGVDLNLAHEFLSGCDCEDDCSNKSSCACHMLTMNQKEVSDANIGYEYRCLPNGQIDTGIFECNALCKCSSRCRNKVVQNDLSRMLQLFRTRKRGWGVRTLYDIPKGGFIAIYAGNVLSDAKANEVGKLQGDEYFAELDLVNFCEENKEGYEEGVVMSDEDEKSTADSDDSNHDSDHEEHSNNRSEQKEKQSGSDDCVVLSGTNRSKTMVAAIAKAPPSAWRISKYIGDDKLYTLDAKISGNIGRYLNHSCSPNVFVQNVFVDTHDLSLPWVAFFASERIKAGTELSWDYRYVVGSVPGKHIKCLCGSANCRRRLL